MLCYLNQNPREENGFFYYGVEAEDQCYCGSNHPRIIPALPSECDSPCVGNNTQMCGSSYRLNLYKNDDNGM